MIAIFKIEKEALEFEQKVHNFLKANRKDYNAEKWGISQIDEVNILWGVKLPPEKIDTTGIKLEENICISQEYYDTKGTEITDISKINISTLTAISKTILTPTKVEPIMTK